MDVRKLQKPWLETVDHVTQNSAVCYLHADARTTNIKETKRHLRQARSRSFAKLNCNSAKSANVSCFLNVKRKMTANGIRSYFSWC